MERQEQDQGPLSRVYNFTKYFASCKFGEHPLVILLSPTGLINNRLIYDIYTIRGLWSCYLLGRLT